MDKRSAIKSVPRQYSDTIEAQPTTPMQNLDRKFTKSRQILKRVKMRNQDRDESSKDLAEFDKKLEDDKVQSRLMKQN